MVHELECRGEDLSGLRIGLLPFLRQIACGTLHPQIVVMFAGLPTAIRQIGLLPYEHQVEIATGARTYEEPPIRVNRRRKPAGPPSGTQSLGDIAETADHRDLADMIVGLVVKSKKPEATLKAVLQDLRGRLTEAGNRAIAACEPFFVEF